MKNLLLAIITTTLITPNLFATEKECLINKDYFEICKSEQVFNADRMQESHLSGTVLELFASEGEKMATVLWPVIGGTTTEITDYKKETVNIDLLISRGGPKCGININENKICKHDSVFDKRRNEESHLSGTVLRLFIDGDIKMAIVSWPVIGGANTDVTSYRKEVVNIDNLY